MKKRRTRYQEVDVSLPALSEAFIAEFMFGLGGDPKSSYLRSEILSKYNGKGTTPASVRRSNAIAKWRATEHKNQKTNARIFFGAEFGWTDFDRLVDRIRSIISSILGPLAYPDVLLNRDITNGASTRVKRSPIAATRKLSREIHVSSKALPHWIQYANNTILSSQTVVVREASVLFTVPKTSVIDRVACKEPEGNMLLQRSVGLHIRSRLRKHGIDLNDQTINQALARDGSRTGELATIDLSSASDSVSQGIVMMLLPREWWALMDDLRVSCTEIDGENHTLEMFSSMGNGFTFELESLIFYAITRAVCWLSSIKGRISVFGDDIIAPSAIVPRLRRVFSFFGFTMNPKKTHHRGPFRESCGAHWYNGYDVSPFYIREPIRTLPTLVNILNQIYHWGTRDWGFFDDPWLARFHLKWSQRVPWWLWGGYDPMDPSALVTGHGARDRLVPILKEIPSEEEGRLRVWLFRKESTSIPLEVTGNIEVGWRASKSRHSLFGQRPFDPYYLIRET